MYGIYNTFRKEFQFGIREKTYHGAFVALRRRIGKDCYKRSFKIRKYPV